MASIATTAGSITNYGVTWLTLASTKLGKYAMAVPAAGLVKYVAFTGTAATTVSNRKICLPAGSGAQFNTTSGAKPAMVFGVKNQAVTLIGLTATGWVPVYKSVAVIGGTTT